MYGYSGLSNAVNTYAILIAIVVILSIAAGWQVLKKAGEKPWKILIPIYGGYCLYKVANCEGVFWGMLCVSLFFNIFSSLSARAIQSSSVILIMSGIQSIILLGLQIHYVRELADSFGKNGGFAAGLFFLFPIFLMILGFGSAQYGSSSGGLESVTASAGTWKCTVCGCENPQSRGICQSCGSPK